MTTAAAGHHLLSSLGGHAAPATHHLGQHGGVDVSTATGHGVTTAPTTEHGGQGVGVHLPAACLVLAGQDIDRTGRGEDAHGIGGLGLLFGLLHRHQGLLKGSDPLLELLRFLIEKVGQGLVGLLEIIRGGGTAASLIPTPLPGRKLGRIELIEDFWHEIVRDPGPVSAQCVSRPGWVLLKMPTVLVKPLVANVLQMITAILFFSGPPLRTPTLEGRGDDEVGPVAGVVSVQGRQGGGDPVGLAPGGEPADEVAVHLALGPLIHRVEISGEVALGLQFGIGGGVGDVGIDFTLKVGPATTRRFGGGGGGGIRRRRCCCSLSPGGLGRSGIGGGRRRGSARDIDRVPGIDHVGIGDVVVGVGDGVVVGDTGAACDVTQGVTGLDGVLAGTNGVASAVGLPALGTAAAALSTATGGQCSVGGRCRRTARGRWCGSARGRWCGPSTGGGRGDLPQIHTCLAWLRVVDGSARTVRPITSSLDPSGIVSGRESIGLVERTGGTSPSVSIQIINRPTQSRIIREKSLNGGFVVILLGLAAHALELGLDGLEDATHDPGAGEDVRLDGLDDVVLGQGQAILVLLQVAGTEEEPAETLAHIVGGGGELVGGLPLLALGLVVRTDIGLKQVKPGHFSSLSHENHDGNCIRSNWGPDCRDGY